MQPNKFHFKIMEELIRTKIMLDVLKKGMGWISSNTGPCGFNTIDIGVDNELYNVSTYMKYVNESEQNILKNCVNNIISLWNDFLNCEIDAWLETACLENNTDIDLNLVAKINFKDLLSNHKKAWKENYIKDFDFLEYKEKLKVIEKIFEIKIDDEYKQKLFQTIEIRNSIQHHDGKVLEAMLRKLGKNSISVYDIEGNIIKFQKGDEINLSVPELMSMRNCLVSLIYRIKKLNGFDYFKLDQLSDCFPSKYKKDDTFF